MGFNLLNEMHKGISDLFGVDSDNPNVRYLTPEESKKAYSKKNYGSETIERQYFDPVSKAAYDNTYFSSLTGNYYPTLEAAQADEAKYASNPQQWHSDRQLAPATGAQTPVVNPNVNPAANGFSIDPSLAGGPLPAPPPKPLAAPTTRAGFTNELSAITTPTVKARPVATSPAIVIGGGGVDMGRLGQTVGPAGQPSGTPQAPGTPAPDINRDKIDQILGGLSGYQNKILDLSEDNTGQSVAEAQLMKADALAKIRARDELAANQRGTLGAARSARNRGDRALLERQAVGEQAYLGSQGQREDVLRQAELEGNLSILRATENEHDRQFKLDALTEAANLGLNRAALEVDISKADQNSANNWINNEARSALQANVLDEQQYEALLNFSSQHTGQLLQFTQAMAGIQYEYDKLSTDDQNVADGLLMQRYGIDKQTMVALKQIKEAGKFHWDEFLGKLLGGGVTGVTSALTGGLVGGGGGGGGGSGVGFDNNVATVYDPNA